MANIYIHIEIPKRELEGKFLLAAKAALRGHRVMLGYLHSILLKDLLTPGIFHDKSLTPRPKKLRLLHAAKNAGHAYTSIDEEHGLLRQDYDNFGSQRYSAETMRLACAIMFWGAHDHDFIARTYPQFRDKLHVTGNPRADLWRPDMDKVFEESLPVKKPIVLVASNLGAIFGQRSTDEIIANMREGYFKGPFDDTEFDIYKLHAYSTELGGEFIKALRRLAIEFPKVNFVLRPHPVEKVEIWKNLIGDYSNIIITNAGSITPWIRQASALIHNGCTSAMEAVKSGTPVLTYTPIKDQNAEFYFPNLLGKTITDIEGLVNAVREVLNTPVGHSQTPKDLRILGERFVDTAGEYAADRIISVWEGLAEKRHNQNTFWKSRSNALFKGTFEFLDVYRLVTPGLLKLARVKKVPVLPQKFPSWRQAELDSLKQRFCRSFPEFDSLRVKKIAPRICVLERQN